MFMVYLFSQLKINLIIFKPKNDLQSFPNFGITTIALAMHYTGASALTVSSHAAAQVIYFLFALN